MYPFHQQEVNSMCSIVSFVQTDYKTSTSPTRLSRQPTFIQILQIFQLGTYLKVFRSYLLRKFRNLWICRKMSDGNEREKWRSIFTLPKQHVMELSSDLIKNPKVVLLSPPLFVDLLIFSVLSRNLHCNH